MGLIILGITPGLLSSLHITGQVECEEDGCFGWATYLVEDTFLCEAHKDDLVLKESNK